MRRNKLNTRLAGCLLSLLAFLSACSHEEGPTPSPDSGLVTLSLQVKTSELPATKGEGEENTETLDKPNEYIHSLIVLLVKDGTIVKRWDVKEGEGASRETWASDQISLETGNYVAYAFANMESLPDESQGFLSGLTEGRTVDGLDETVVTMFKDDHSYDPETGTYLPMSRCYPFKLTENTTVTIPLVRMLSRVEVSVERDGERKETISDFSFSGFVDNMNLFVNPYELNDVTGHNQDDKLMTPDGANIVIPEYKKDGEWNGQPFYFYVSETKKQGDDKFTINLKLGDAAISRTLTRTVLVRNRIWPIHLLIKSVQCEYDFEGGNQPIGGSEEIKSFVDENNNYVCGIKGGGRFTLSLTGVKRIGDESPIKINKWKITSEQHVQNKLHITESEYQGENCTIKGRLPSKDGETDLKVTATGEDEKTYDFTFLLKHEDLFKK